MLQPLKGVRVARVSTTLLFVITNLADQLLLLDRAGANLSIITKPDAHAQSMISRLQFKFKYIPIKIYRPIRLIADLFALFRLIYIFKKERFDIVHSVTPKAGLLCAIAAKVVGVPVRLHTFTGQVWANSSGIKRQILVWCDQLIGRLNTHCYADSPSQRDFLLSEKIISHSDITVLGSGSLAGVNLERWNPQLFSKVDKDSIRCGLKIAQDTQVLLFLGRINREKGIYDLIDSLLQLKQKKLNVVLLVVGLFETGAEDSVRQYAKKSCQDSVIFTGFCSDPEKYMAVADILCLPSSREGFGSVVIEASAMELPVVATNIYGLTDAVIDGETGILVEPHNVSKLTCAIERLLNDNSLRFSIQKKAKHRVVKEFTSEHLGELMINQYVKQINATKNT